MGLSLMHISPRLTGSLTLQEWDASITLQAKEKCLDYAIELLHLLDAGKPAPRRLNPYPVTNPRLRIAAGGLLFQVKTEGTQPEWCVGKKRGKVKHFSRAARNRAMQLLMSVNIDKAGGLPILITLTYPNEYPSDGPTTKGHLDAWLKRLLRKYPSAAAVWKVEPQKRGAPHYHLLVFGARYIDKDWVATTWAAVVDSGDAKHIHAGTRTEAVLTYNGVVAYAAKYICKRVEDNQNWTVGRWWGVHNRSALPVDILEIDLSDRQYYQIRRILQAYLLSKGVVSRRTRVAKGFTAYLPERKGLDIVNVVAE